MKTLLGIVLTTALFAVCVPREAQAYIDSIQVTNASNKCAMFTLYQRPNGINTQEYYSGEHHIVLPGESASFRFIWRTATYAKMNVDVYHTHDCSGKSFANTYDRFDNDMNNSSPHAIRGALHLLGNGWYRFWFHK